MHGGLVVCLHRRLDLIIVFSANSGWQVRFSNGYCGNRSRVVVLDNMKIRVYDVL